MAGRRPLTASMNVDLPHPDPPSRTTNCRGGTTRPTSRSSHRGRPVSRSRTSLPRCRTATASPSPAGRGTSRSPSNVSRNGPTDSTSPAASGWGLPATRPPLTNVPLADRRSVTACPCRDRRTSACWRDTIGLSSRQPQPGSRPISVDSPTSTGRIPATDGWTGGRPVPATTVASHAAGASPAGDGPVDPTRADAVGSGLGARMPTRTSTPPTDRRSPSRSGTRPDTRLPLDSVPSRLSRSSIQNAPSTPTIRQWCRLTHPSVTTKSESGSRPIRNVQACPPDGGVTSTRRSRCPSWLSVSCGVTGDAPPSRPPGPRTGPTRPLGRVLDGHP